MKTNLLLISALLVLGAGCTNLSYKSPTGEKFRRTSIGNKTGISSLEITPQTNAAPKVLLKGYQSDSAAGIQSAVELFKAGIEAGKAVK